MANYPRKLNQDPLVEQLRPAPDEPAVEAIELRGFLGRSEKPGLWRLYETADLDSYYEIPEEHIISHEPAASGAVAGRVLVRKGKVQLVRTVDLERRSTSMHRQATFLQGEYSTLLDKVSSERGGGLGGRGSVVAESGILCDVLHTWGGGYSCPVYRRGEKLHDSINVTPCAYSLGFDPGCEKSRPNELITQRAFCTWSCSWHEWC